MSALGVDVTCLFERVFSGPQDVNRKCPRFFMRYEKMHTILNDLKVRRFFLNQIFKSSNHQPLAQRKLNSQIFLLIMQ